jgi:hypothetical protein
VVGNASSEGVSVPVAAVEVEPEVRPTSSSATSSPATPLSETTDRRL